MSQERRWREIEEAAPRWPDLCPPWALTLLWWMSGRNRLFLLKGFRGFLCFASVLIVVAMELCGWAELCPEWQIGNRQREGGPGTRCLPLRYLSWWPSSVSLVTSAVCRTSKEVHLPEARRSTWTSVITVTALCWGGAPLCIVGRWTRVFYLRDQPCTLPAFLSCRYWPHNCPPLLLFIWQSMGCGWRSVGLIACTAAELAAVCTVQGVSVALLGIVLTFLLSRQRATACIRRGSTGFLWSHMCA